MNPVAGSCRRHNFWGKKSPIRLVSEWNVSEAAFLIFLLLIRLSLWGTARDTSHDVLTAMLGILVDSWSQTSMNRYQKYKHEQNIYMEHLKTQFLITTANTPALANAPTTSKHFTNNMRRSSNLQPNHHPPVDDENRLCSTYHVLSFGYLLCACSFDAKYFARNSTTTCLLRRKMSSTHSNLWRYKVWSQVITDDSIACHLQFHYQLVHTSTRMPYWSWAPGWSWRLKYRWSSNMARSLNIGYIWGSFPLHSESYLLLPSHLYCFFVSFL